MALGWSRRPDACGARGRRRTLALEFRIGERPDVRPRDIRPVGGGLDCRPGSDARAPRQRRVRAACARRQDARSNRGGPASRERRPPSPPAPSRNGTALTRASRTAVDKRVSVGRGVPRRPPDRHSAAGGRAGCPRGAPVARRASRFPALRARDPSGARPGAPPHRHSVAGDQAVTQSGHLTRLCVLAWALSAGAGVLAAQSSDTLFATGVRAYKNLEFDLAAWLLRRDVTQLTAASAPAAERAKGLVYLGAAELYRGRRDSAVAVFRRLVMLDPRYRPDRLVFPPEVTSLFDGVRLQIKTVAVEGPPGTTITPRPGGFDIWVISSSFQTVEVTLRYEDGAPFRPLYSGPIGDSLKVPWDGLDAAGAPPPVNPVLLRVASRTATGHLAGLVPVPPDPRVSRPGTLS